MTLKVGVLMLFIGANEIIFCVLIASCFGDDILDSVIRSSISISTVFQIFSFLSDFLPSRCVIKTRYT